MVLFLLHHETDIISVLQSKVLETVSELLTQNIQYNKWCGGSDEFLKVDVVQWLFTVKRGIETPSSSTPGRVVCSSKQTSRRSRHGDFPQNTLFLLLFHTVPFTGAHSTHSISILTIRDSWSDHAGANTNEIRGHKFGKSCELITKFLSLEFSFPFPTRPSVLKNGLY